MRPTKTQISLRIRAVWSNSSLSAWRNFASLASQNVPGEGSDQTAQAGLNRRWAHTPEGKFSYVVAHFVILMPNLSARNVSAPMTCARLQCSKPHLHVSVKWTVCCPSFITENYSGTSIARTTLYCRKGQFEPVRVNHSVRSGDKWG